MGCRSLDKAEKAKSEIEKKNTADTEIIIIKIDLSSLESIKSFGDQWSDQDPSCRKCDLLFCNAGLIVPNADMSTTEDNFEMTYQVGVHWAQPFKTITHCSTVQRSRTPRTHRASSASSFRVRRSTYHRHFIKRCKTH